MHACMRDSLHNALFIGFTGTPIELEDRNTVNVFGDYIHRYDIYQAVEDGATVTILYTNRTAKLGFAVDYPEIDEAFDYVTEREEVEKKEKLKSKWSRLEAVVGTDDRIRNLAKDIVNHFDFRYNEIGGKGLAVCMSRRICVKLHDEIIKLKPDWRHKDDDKGFIKVVMTGTASETEWQEHIRNKRRRRAIADRMRDPLDSFRLGIVRDMWLTGFNAPALHTIYIDKPMKGHTLTQAIARVNRVHPGKDAGLVVDYIGIGPNLRKALAEQTTRKPRDREHEQEQAAQIMMEKFEVVQAHFQGFNYTPFFSASPTNKMVLTKNAIEHILRLKDGKERFLKNSLELIKAYNITIPLDEALKIRDFVGFIKLLRAQIVKNFVIVGGRTKEELDAAINQILSRAIATEEIIDLFKSIGLKKPDISILSPEFLEDVKKYPQKNVVIELMRKILNDEIKAHYKKNFTQGKAYSEKLRNTVIRYHNRSIETLEVIKELIQIAQEIKQSKLRGESLGLTEDELAFYDALGTNDSAVKVLGNAVLKKIAIELTETIRRNVKIDWTLRENIQAKLRVMVKRILRKYGYPPDKQKKATETVLEQANLLCADWAENPPIILS